MEVKVRALTASTEVLNAARVTVWKDAVDKMPSETFLDEIYMSEHSPIRDKWFVIEITGVKSWLATHFVRHHVGSTPYVSTQRDDRLNDGVPRDEKHQGELVNVRLTLNAQSIIDISQKRLCGAAHWQAQLLWRDVAEQIQHVEPQLGTKCVPTCVYRGFCPEKVCCGRVTSDHYKLWRKKYINGRPTIGQEEEV